VDSDRHWIRNGVLGNGGRRRSGGRGDVRRTDLVGIPGCRSDGTGTVGEIAGPCALRGGARLSECARRSRDRSRPATQCPGLGSE
jgi:hypothetical protein